MFYSPHSIKYKNELFIELRLNFYCVWFRSTNQVFFYSHFFLLHISFSPLVSEIMRYINIYHYHTCFSPSLFFILFFTQWCECSDRWIDWQLLLTHTFFSLSISYLIWWVDYTAVYCVGYRIETFTDIHHFHIFCSLFLSFSLFDGVIFQRIKDAHIQGRPSNRKCKQKNRQVRLSWPFLL
jgi:hypothetical protein